MCQRFLEQLSGVEVRASRDVGFHLTCRVRVSMISATHADALSLKSQNSTSQRP